MINQKANNKILEKKRIELLKTTEIDPVTKKISIGENDPKKYMMYGLDFYINNFFKNEGNLFMLNSYTTRIKYKVQHTEADGIYLNPEQYLALKSMSNTNSKITSIISPTSFGKTFIALEYIYRNKEIFKKIAIIVPTNALAFELEKKLKNNKKFNDNWIIFDTVKNNENFNNEERLLFVGTQEKLASLGVDGLQLMIIDEAYKLADGGVGSKTRTFLLNKNLIDASEKNGLKLILLTPPCNLQFDYDELKIDEKNVNFFSTNFNIVSSIYNERKKINAKLFEEIEKDSPGKTIVYVHSPSKISSIYKEIPEFELLNIQSEIISDLESEFGNMMPLIEPMKRGLLIHHGKMPKYLQNYALSLFEAEEKIKYLIGTRSIAEGINTPCRNVVLKSAPTEKTNDEWLMVFKNMIGRAGRMGEFPIGNIYSTTKKELFEAKVQQKEIDLRVTVSEDNDEQFTYKKESGTDPVNLESDDKDAISEFIKRENFSKKYIKALLEAIKKPCDKPSLLEAYYIYQKFKSNIEKNGTDKIELYLYISNLQSSFVFFDKSFNFRNHKERVNSLNEIIRLDPEIKNIDIEQIYNKYFNFRYSSLQYEYMNFVKLFSEFIKDDKLLKIINENISPGVLESIKILERNYIDNFWPKYIDTSDENVKKIIEKLIEYGVEFNEMKFQFKDNKKDEISFNDLYLFVSEISSTIGKRYSIYDIKRKIEKMCIDKNRIAILIYKKYFKIDWYNLKKV